MLYTALHCPQSRSLLYSAIQCFTMSLVLLSPIHCFTLSSVLLSYTLLYIVLSPPLCFTLLYIALHYVVLSPTSYYSMLHNVIHLIHTLQQIVLSSAALLSWYKMLYKDSWQCKVHSYFTKQCFSCQSKAKHSNTLHFPTSVCTDTVQKLHCSATQYYRLSSSDTSKWNVFPCYITMQLNNALLWLYFKTQLLIIWRNVEQCSAMLCIEIMIALHIV